MIESIIPTQITVIREFSFFTREINNFDRNQAGMSF